MANEWGGAGGEGVVATGEGGGVGDSWGRNWGEDAHSELKHTQNK